VRPAGPGARERQTMVEFTEPELIYAYMLLGRALLDAIDA
jgi:hypothetical protein